MTMVAIATHGKTAEIVTDTMSYSPGVEKIGYVTKVMILAHLDAAVAGQGDGRFTTFTKVALLDESNGYPDFDAMIDDVPQQLRRVWNDILAIGAEEGHDTQASTVFVVGFSPRVGEFVAYRFDSDVDFDATQIESGFAAVPMPYVYRPSTIEANRMRTAFVEQYGATSEDADQVLDQWCAASDPPKPKGADQWRTFGKLVRETRALQHFGRVLVGGKLVHTQLAQGRFSSTVIHRFDDDSELLQLVAGTDHPRAADAPCVLCESGLPFRECHGPLVERAP